MNKKVCETNNRIWGTGSRRRASNASWVHQCAIASKKKLGIVKAVWTDNAEFDLDDLYDLVAKDSPIHVE